MVDERLEARLARHAGCAEVEARDMVHRGEYGGGVLRRKGEDGACFGTIGRVCVVLREERGGEYGALYGSRFEVALLACGGCEVDCC